MVAGTIGGAHDGRGLGRGQDALPRRCQDWTSSNAGETNDSLLRLVPLLLRTQNMSTQSGTGCQQARPTCMAVLKKYAKPQLERVANGVMEGVMRP